MNPAVQVRRSRPAEAAALVPALAQLLIDCVAAGASVSFMHPLGRDRAEAFWRGVTDGAARGERVLLVAEDGAGAIVGTVQVVLAMPENQPHRGEIAKLLVHRRARRTGLGIRLMQAIEQEARQSGFRLLTLDAKAGGEADALYRKLGWIPAGTIPSYALDPDGRASHDAVIFYRNL
jgi:GNAT superfamily N-acetyltransferase